MTDKQIIIDGKTIGCPCYINRPLHRYDKACLVQSQAFTEQQTEEKPILRCDEIKNCPIKENYKQLERKEQECKNNKIAHQMELDIYNQECLNLQEELKAKEQECEELKKRLIQKDEVNTFFNTLDWNSDPCEICPKKNCLDEIEGIVNFISNITNCDKAYYCKDKLDEILQKISEVI